MTTLKFSELPIRRNGMIENVIFFNITSIQNFIETVKFIGSKHWKDGTKIQEYVPYLHYALIKHQDECGLEFMTRDGFNESSYSSIVFSVDQLIILKNLKTWKNM